MSSTQRFRMLYSVMRDRVPEFNIKFKDDSMFMRILGKILFFTPGFMNNYTTVIGSTVYFPNKDFLDKKPMTCLRTLCHEYVHVMDSIRKPIRYNVSYLMPQVLSLFALLAIPFSLWFLLFLLFLLPIPSPWRKNIELRGYGMTCKTFIWDNKCIDADKLDTYIKQFTTSRYYFMYPFKKRIEKELKNYIYSDECLKDKNPAYRDVQYIFIMT